MRFLRTKKNAAKHREEPDLAQRKHMETTMKSLQWIFEDPERKKIDR